MAEVQSHSKSGNNDKENKTDNKILIRGIFLEGARWYRSVGSNSQSQWGLTELVSSTGKRGGKLVTELRNEMPLIKLWTVKRDAQNKETLFKTESDTYVCPVYSNSNRTDLNYVFDIPLKSLSSNVKARHWVLRGVCLTTI